ncbi:MAG: hypothetical protein KC656_16940 [Myxococcales bacterium]|nr:hypothetical protein [Myxococcales bacterium]
MRVFAVWEPILDGQPPPRPEAVARLTDSRVVQLWDPDRTWSDAMRDLEPITPHARWRTGETEAGVLYDTVVVFPAKSRWRGTLPAPSLLVGGLEANLDALRDEVGK